MSIVTDANLFGRNFSGTTRSGGLGVRARPERLVLGPREGAAASAKPPVRIFLGTEQAQHRAERIFIWSIEQVRDPSRVYEIHLMKDLAGFNRFGWLTGFTNYRFAIPYFAGAGGRAIYNDVDQIYLSDPAELFDTDMDGHGVLAIAPGGRIDTSVMLIDCARMAGVWPLGAAQRKRKNRLIAMARALPGLVGALAPEWNARDEEYAAGRSKVLHFTALHLQPWQPFPRRFTYQRNPLAEIWLDMERRADEERYQAFGFHRPSAHFSDLAARIGEAPTGGAAPESGLAADEGARLADLLEKVEARTVLEFGLSLGAADRGLGEDGRSITRYDPSSPHLATPPREPFDAVVCGDGLAWLPDGDVAWVIDELFRYARRLLYVALPDRPRSATLADGTRLGRRVRSASWWYACLAEASARHPEVHWRLVPRRRIGGGRAAGGRWGGASLDGGPRVWILDDGKPGHTTQSLGLVEALGWPYEVKQLSFNALAGFGNLLPGGLGASRLGLDSNGADVLAPPWPDVVVATGWRPAPVSRWIGKRSRGGTRLVQLGRKGGRIARHFDAVISCAYFHLPASKRRIESTVPLNRVSGAGLDEAARRWPDLFEGAPRPHIALLVGGTSRRHVLEPDKARRLGEDVRALAEAAGGTVVAVTSRRTGEAATEALAAGLGAGAHVDRWQPDRQGNPYLAYLALADILVVSGESESMLAEAAATDKPLHVYPVAERPPGLWTRVEMWVGARAHRRSPNRRGTIRPQQGIEHLCASLIGRGIVQPRRDLKELHKALYRRGSARPFGDPLETGTHGPLREADEVAAKVRALLGLSGP